jgi:hypothetical protein
LLGGLAAVAITFVLNVGSKAQPAVVMKSRMQTYWAVIFIVAGIGTLSAILPSLVFSIESNEGYYSDSQILVTYAVTLGVLLLAVGLILGGAYLFQSSAREGRHVNIDVSIRCSGRVS